METGKINDPLMLIALLYGSITSDNRITFKRKIGFEEIEYKPHHLLPKPLIELLDMKDMYYIIEEPNEKVNKESMHTGN